MKQNYFVAFALLTLLSLNASAHTDVEGDKRAMDLVSRMTLEEKCD